MVDKRGCVKTENFDYAPNVRQNGLEARHWR